MYRISRNIEASLIDQITELLEEDGWQNIRVEKSFLEARNGTLPCICVNALEFRPVKKEIGSKLHIKYFTVNIRIFCKTDGSRLDLSDWLFDELENNLNYYSYNITDGEVSEKNLSGRIVVTRFFDNKKELTNTENLAKEDRYRHLLSFECYIA
jgi:hypothetical protein